MSKLEAECLECLWTVTWDGELNSKAARDALFEAGLVQRWSGFNWLTAEGVVEVLALKVARGDGNPPDWRRHHERALGQTFTV